MSSGRIGPFSGTDASTPTAGLLKRYGDDDTALKRPGNWAIAGLPNGSRTAQHGWSGPRIATRGPVGWRPRGSSLPNWLRTIARFEPVHLLADTEEAVQSARDRVGRRSAESSGMTSPPTIHGFATTVRLFLAADPDLPPALVDWRYNAWGNKYPPSTWTTTSPDESPSKPVAYGFRSKWSWKAVPWMATAENLLLTTESCLLNPNRNPQLDRPAVEQRLRDYLSVEQIIWLTGEIPGDDTDGHIDQIARFVDRSTIVAVTGPDGRMLRENSAPHPCVERVTAT